MFLIDLLIGDTGLTPMNFTVTLCFASANNVTLNYNTGGGTAAGTNYVSGDGGTVTIPAGSLTGTFAIQVKRRFDSGSSG